MQKKVLRNFIYFFKYKNNFDFYLIKYFYIKKIYIFRNSAKNFRILPFSEGQFFNIFKKLHLKYVHV